MVLFSSDICWYNAVMGLVLLKSPVINKPLPLLSTGSAATTKKICLSGMSANQPQQRSRRISIILTPNLTVSNSECRDTSLHICLVDVCWACLAPLQLFTGTSGSMCRKGAQRKWVLQWRFLFYRFIYLFGSGINLNEIRLWRACVLFVFQRHGYCTLGEALNRLDFSSAIQDLRRFNYVAKVGASESCHCRLSLHVFFNFLCL